MFWKLRNTIPAAALLLCASFGVMPAIAGTPDAEGSSGQLEASACAILDESALPEFAFTPQQQAAWLRLAEEHRTLIGEGCHEMFISGNYRTLSDAAQPSQSAGSQSKAMQAYGRHLLGFLMSLSPEQRTVLDETVSARQKAAADLREKILLHNLML